MQRDQHRDLLPRCQSNARVSGRRIDGAWRRGLEDVKIFRWAWRFLAHYGAFWQHVRSCFSTPHLRMASLDAGAVLGHRPGGHHSTAGQTHNPGGPQDAISIYRSCVLRRFFARWGLWHGEPLTLLAAQVEFGNRLRRR